jgi:hypothetical protein
MFGNSFGLLCVRSWNIRQHDRSIELHSVPSRLIMLRSGCESGSLRGWLLQQQRSGQLHSVSSGHVLGSRCDELHELRCRLCVRDIVDCAAAVSDGHKETARWYVSCSPHPICTPPTESSTTASACTTCEPGTYANTTGMTSCRLCPSGHDCFDPAMPPSECAPGRYSLGGAVANCTWCAAGTYSNTSGSTSCTVCPKGSSCSSRSELPSLCLAGTFSPAGATVCTVCSANTFSNTTGASTCLSCGTGTFCSSSSSNPESCPAGTYKTSTGMTHQATLGLRFLTSIRSAQLHRLRLWYLQFSKGKRVFDLSRGLLVLRPKQSAGAVWNGLLQCRWHCNKLHAVPNRFGSVSSATSHVLTIVFVRNDELICKRWVSSVLRRFRLPNPADGPSAVRTGVLQHQWHKHRVYDLPSRILLPQHVQRAEIMSILCVLRRRLGADR